MRTRVTLEVMIKVSDIYSKTHDGLDIILDYYPQAEGCVDNKKKFKRRPEEDDASACIKKFKVNNDYEVYKVTDFGDQSTAMSPVDICMYEEGISFSEAIFKLASRYNVTNELNKSVNKPDIRKRPAKADEKEGSRFFELEKTFTADQLKIMGPRVKQEHIDRLNWYVAKSISYVKNREVTTKYTTPTYPIFMRECIVQSSNDPEKVVKFYKIYEPLNPDKQWRFSYTPDGVKPKEFINGLEELKKLYREYNAKEEKSLEDILDFHVKFERIHPFQDGNGRVGRLIMFKECLKYNIVPFIIEDDLKMFYYRGLKEWDNSYYCNWLLSIPVR